MKVLQYFENPSLIKKSGIGHAQKLQQEELSFTDVEVTTSPHSSDYDLVDINTYGPKSFFMARHAHKNSKAVVYHAHSTYEDFRNSFILSNFFAPFFKKHLINSYKQADLIITPTVYSKKLLESYGLKQPIIPISNGVRVSDYGYRPDNVIAFRKFLGLSHDDKRKIVLSVGLFFARKGILDFIELARRNPEYIFVWLGNTNLSIIPSKIRKAVLKFHPDNCLFPGYLNGSDLFGAYSDSDLFLFPSYEETEGIVVLEALASRQKLLVRDIPVYNDWLYDGKNCYKASSIDEFDDKLNLILHDQLPDLSDAGFATAESRDVSKIGKKIKNAYQEALSLFETKKGIQ
ncbi:glycosyltransferase family 4 protein [Oenococcus alcoholitolerans]|uniref:glycosyltransferase family 4 protein n=1 Tax=Oenococcus alcoholitolerans TaxID=931074 RepID=UPI003F72491F